MSIGTVLTLGLGAFTGGGVKFLPTLGYGTSGTNRAYLRWGGRTESERRARIERDDAEILGFVKDIIIPEIVRRKNR